MSGSTEISASRLRASREGHFSIEDKENWLNYLETHGYVVIKNVATPEQCSHAMELFWDYLESIPTNEGMEIKRGDASTWEDRRWFPGKQNGLMNGYGCGQSELLWYTRLLPKVETAFKNIWGEDKRMLVSFDGCNAFRPWKLNPEWKTNGGWWHVDQNSVNDAGRGKVCIQGLVSFLDADETTGGLCVIAGSHKQHDVICQRTEMAHQLGPDASDFVMLSANDPILSDESDHRLLCCSAGDLILWDSRTVHCNHPALESSSLSSSPPSSSTPSSSLIRLVAYVCMTPYEWATAETIQKRCDAFIHNESTSHWPHRFFSAGGRACASWIPEKDPAVISSKQRELIGFSPQLSTIEYISSWSIWKHFQFT